MEWVKKAAGAAAAGYLLLFSWWFYCTPLYNSASAPENRLLRSDILVAAVSDPAGPASNLFVDAARRLAHVENLPQRAPIFLRAALIVLVATLAGGLVRRAVLRRIAFTATERLVIDYGLGMGAVSLAMQFAGLAGNFYLVALFGAVVVVAWVWIVVRVIVRKAPEYEDSRQSAARSPHVESQSSVVARSPDRATDAAPFWLKALLIVAIAPFVVLAFLAAALPTTDFDALGYHLLGPKEYFLAGKISFLPHNVYTTFPFLTEMFHLLGMVLANDWKSGALVGQVTIATFVPMTGLLVGILAQRIAGAAAGWMAGFVFLTTPWVYRLAAIPYVEGALLFYTTLAVYAAMRTGTVARSGDRATTTADHAAHVVAWSPSVAAWSPDHATRWALAAGMFAGLAASCKYTGLFTAAPPAIILFAFPFRRREVLLRVIAFLVGLAVCFGPWLVRNAAWTGNPVYPLASSVFQSRDWTAEQAANFSDAHRSSEFTWRTIARYISLPLLPGATTGEIPLSSDWQGALVFAFAPLAVLGSGRRRAAVVWGLVLYEFFVFWLLTHRLDRFWLPLEPFAAALAGVGMAAFGGRWLRMLAASLAALAVVYQLAYCTTWMCGLNEYTADLQTQRVRNLAMEPAVALANELAGKDAQAVVLFVGYAAVFDAEPAARYNTVFNANILESIARDTSAPDQILPALEILDRFESEGITHVVVDWSWIARYRAPDNYGYSDFVTRALFERLVEDNALRFLAAMGRIDDGASVEVFRVNAQDRAAALPSR